MSKLTELEQVIGYEFNEQRLLQQALTHSSFAVSYTHLTLPTTPYV